MSEGIPASKRATCAGCGKDVWRSKTSAETQFCRECRALNRARPKPLDPSKCGTPRGRDQHRHRGEPVCEPCRQAWNEISKKRMAALKERGWVRPDRRNREPSAYCLGCGQPVSGAYRKDRPYHRACRERDERAERKRAAAVARLSKAAEGSRGVRVWVAGECAQCLGPFVRGGQSSPYCSKRCNRRARPTKRQWRISTRNRLAIYDRDGWICQLCTEPVDRDLMATDPLNDWAPSLDHIEPQSWALIPDHSPENLRLAHRWCNSVRGDLSHYDERDLQVA